MKKLTLIALATLALGSLPAFAQTDAHTAHKDTAKTRTVKYTCQSGKKVSITYGFNKQNLPTYAQANLDGKTRFMPINLSRSDNMDTVFGDENNYSLMSNAITLKTVKKSHISIQDPASGFTHKGCNVAKR